MQIYTTRKVNNQVDFRIVSKIIEILRKKSKVKFVRRIFQRMKQDFYFKILQREQL